MNSIMELYGMYCRLVLAVYLLIIREEDHNQACLFDSAT